MREAILFYRSFYNAIRLLGDKARLKLYDSVMELYFDCDENLSNLEQLCAKIETKLAQNRSIFAQFLLIKPQIIANLIRYKNGCKGAEYGTLGGAPKGNKNACKNNPETTPKEERVMNKEEGVMKNDSFLKKEKKEKKLNFSEKENFKNSLSSFCENNFNFPSENQAFKEEEPPESAPLEQNKGEVYRSAARAGLNAAADIRTGFAYPNAPDLEDFEERGGTICTHLEEEKQAVTSCNQLERTTNCSQLESVTGCHGLARGELCPNVGERQPLENSRQRIFVGWNEVKPAKASNRRSEKISDKKFCNEVQEGEPLENSRQLTQDTRPRWDRNYDLMFDTEINKVFEIYAKECKSLIPIGYEKRDAAFRQKIKEFLDVISGDFAYFKDVCRKANELKAIKLTNSKRKIDLKTLINCHARISSGFYEVEENNARDDLYAIAEAAQKRYEENCKK